MTAIKASIRKDNDRKPIFNGIGYILTNTLKSFFKGTGLTIGFEVGVN